MATEEELEVLFGKGLSEETGDLVPLPAMPLLSPAPGPDEPSVAQAVEQGHMRQEETGEVDDVEPELDEIQVGDEVQLPDGRTEAVAWIDPKRKRLAAGHGRHRTFYSLTEVEELNGRRVADAMTRERKKQAREEGMRDDSPPVVLPETIDVPEGLSLYPHQLENVAFIEQQGRGLIADEMGLGKSISALVCIQKPAVIVCPALLKVNWARETNKWLPDMSVTVVNGSEEPDTSGKNADIVIVNYAVLHSHLDWLMARPNRTLVADEAHYMKDLSIRWNKRRREHYAMTTSSRRAKAFYDLHKRVPRILLLTGTPILNRVKELFPLLHMLDHREWGSGFEFCVRYCAGKYEFLARANKEIFDCDGRSNMDELHQRIKNVYMSRHTKEAELANLPPKSRRSMAVSLSPTYAKRYRRARNDFLNWLAEQGEPEAVGRALRGKALTKLTKLRAICAAGKAEATTKYIVNFFESTGRPLVVMGVHLDAFDLITAGLDRVNEQVGDFEAQGDMPPISRPIRYGKVIGGQSDTQRQSVIDAFQNGDLDVVLYSIPIATGTTLTRASDMVFFERMWRPADQLQAEDRIHRIGQEQKVQITYLDAEGTVDMKLAALLMDKARTAAAVIDGVDLTDEQAAALVFGEMVGFGEQEFASISEEAGGLQDLVPNLAGPEWAEEQMVMDIGPLGPVPIVFDEDGNYFDDYESPAIDLREYVYDVYEHLAREGVVRDSWGDPQ